VPTELSRRWGGYAALACAAASITYFILLPLLLPRLWPEARLPLALLSGTALLFIVAALDAERSRRAAQVARAPQSSTRVGRQPPDRTPGGQAASPAASATQVEKHYEDLLLRKAHGDWSLVERLVSYEHERSPSAPRAELLKAAVERWENDLR
jgi:hypothetical protein